MTRPVRQAYNDKVAAGLIRWDRAQDAIVSLLDDLRIDVERASNPKGRAGGLWGRLRKPRLQQAVRGLYLWGDVGRGKSMLVDLFFESLTITDKRRVHFHAYLLELHAAIHVAQRAGSDDPIQTALAQTGRGLSLLVLDEMDVSDIGDAMILDRAFRHLMGQGLCIVTTSNRPPGQLYRNGLKRELFVPFIEMLERSMQVVEIEGLTDWRRQLGAGDRVFFLAGDPGFDAKWRQAVPSPMQPLMLDLMGRQIVLPEAGRGCARAGFADLCSAPLGPADYNRIARSVRVLFLDHVPRLGAAQRDEIRRFVTLIDEIYEARTGLVMRSEAPPDELFAPDVNVDGTRRLISRLAQMQSEAWTRRPESSTDDQSQARDL